MPTVPVPFEVLVSSGEVECSPRSYAWAAAIDPGTLESWEHWDGEPIARARAFCIGGEALTEFVAVSAVAEEEREDLQVSDSIPPGIVDIVLDLLESTGVEQCLPGRPFWDALQPCLREAGAEQYLDDIAAFMGDPAYIAELLRELGVRSPAAETLSENLERVPLSENLERDPLSENLERDHLSENLERDHSSENLERDHSSENLERDPSSENLERDHGSENLERDHGSENLERGLGESGEEGDLEPASDIVDEAQAGRAPSRSSSVQRKPLVIYLPSPLHRPYLVILHPARPITPYPTLPSLPYPTLP
jgi:hypothetical protein